MVAKGLRTINYSDGGVEGEPQVVWTEIKNCQDCPLVSSKEAVAGFLLGKPPFMVYHCGHNRLITQATLGIIQTTKCPETGIRDDCPLPVMPETTEVKR